MIGELEDKYFNDKDKQDYILGLEEKLLGDKKSYYLRGDDLFGDKYQGLSFEGRISTRKEMVEWGIYAEFLILMYSTMAMFPPKVSKIVKMLVIAVGLGIGHITLTLAESKNTDTSSSRHMQNFFFDLDISGIKFDQFCIHNLTALTKAIASSLLMTIIFLAHLFSKSDSDRIVTKVRSIYQDKKSSIKDTLNNWYTEEVDKMIEDKEAQETKNSRFLKLLMLILVGFVAYSKYENYVIWSAEQKIDMQTDL